MAISSQHVPEPAVLASAHARTRTDIQALRGWAVLSVVLYHGGLASWLSAGYLGVDIFFVISGYLITDLIRRGLESGSFSFAGFYARRAKRLLPAAYVVFVVTAVAALLILPARELRDFMAQLLGATTLTANLVLWNQTGYFAEPAATKPLLHTWSLSLEEQYYLLVPAALVFTPRRWWGVAAVVAFALSLGLCLSAVSTMPGATFYLLPTRAWELALGSVGALLGHRWARSPWLRQTYWPCVIGLLALPFFELPMPHPGLAALLACACTLVILVVGESKAQASPLLWLPARMGDMSYSLYLVHWPLLALAANAWLTQPPLPVRLSLMLAAFVFAWLLYTFVEQPIRSMPVSRRTTIALVAATALLAIAGVGGLVLYAREASTAAPRAANVGLNGDCEYGQRFDARAACQNSKHPHLMIWGDSQAMHIVDAIASSTDVGVIQATKTTCGPLLSISTFTEASAYNRKWAQGCLAFNRSVLEYLASAPGIEVVVLVSWLTQYTEGNRVLEEAAGSPTDTRETAGSQTLALHALRTTITRLHAMGKKVVLISPAPSSGFDVGRCLEQKALGKLSFGADTPLCEIDVVRFHAARSAATLLLDAVDREGLAPVIRLDSQLCGLQTCRVTLGDVPLYRDAVHFSREGSREFGRSFGLGAAALSIAR